MRVLEFLVQGQILKVDPSCDFSSIIPGTNGYLQAHFQFSEEWNGFQKVAGFSSGPNEYPPQLLDRNNTCKIPAEALGRSIFRVQILGKKGTARLTTNKVLVQQEGGNV